MECDYTGVINIYKEKGYTSHDVVNIVRKTLGRVKTGHTGTLDPDAEGVLPVCVGKATKIADYIAADVKVYRATLTLGANTDTEDATGVVTETFPVHFDAVNIEEAINSFKGDYLQTPPMYSALKVNGKKLYELAREGKEIERKKRLITIYDAKILALLPPDTVQFEVTCSKGTYIRTLCYDIGKYLGTGGHMSALTRTRTGSFRLENSITIQTFKEQVAAGNAAHIIMKLEDALADYAIVYVDEAASVFLYNGNKIPLKYVHDCEKIIGNDKKFLVKDCCNKLIGIYLLNEDCIVPVTMLS